MLILNRQNCVQMIVLLVSCYFSTLNTNEKQTLALKKPIKKRYCHLIKVIESNLITLSK